LPAADWNSTETAQHSRVPSIRTDLCKDTHRAKPMVANLKRVAETVGRQQAAQACACFEGNAASQNARGGVSGTETCGATPSDAVVGHSETQECSCSIETCRARPSSSVVEHSDT